MRIVCLSDTHNLHDRIRVPEGDLLLHAGDATSRGTEKEVSVFADWLAGLPHRHKVVVAGNHDFLGVLDRVVEGRQEGCAELLKAVGRVRPRLHLFGHIHEAYGLEVRDGTTFVNASICDRACRPVNPPVVVDL